MHSYGSMHNLYFTAMAFVHPVDQLEKNTISTRNSSKYSIYSPSLWLRHIRQDCMPSLRLWRLLIVICRTVFMVVSSWRCDGKIYSNQFARLNQFQLILMGIFHRRSQDFLRGGGVHFPWPKIWWLFFSHHPLLHGHIRHILPPTTLRGCTSPNSAPFLPHSNKNA